MRTGVEMIMDERQRQIDKGETCAHDDQHINGELAMVAAACAMESPHAGEREAAAAAIKRIERRQAPLPQELHVYFNWGVDLTPYIRIKVPTA